MGLQKEFNKKALDTLKEIAGSANPLYQNLAIAGGASAQDRLELADEYMTILMRSRRITGATILDWDGLELTSPEQFRELFSQEKTAIIFDEVGKPNEETHQTLRIIVEFMQKKDGPVFILTGEEDKIHGLLNMDEGFRHRMSWITCPEKEEPVISVALEEDMDAPKRFEIKQKKLKPQKPASP